MKNLVLLIFLLATSNSIFAQEQEILRKLYIHRMNSKESTLARPNLVLYKNDGFTYMRFTNGLSQVYGKIVNFKVVEEKEPTETDDGFVTWTFDWVDVTKYKCKSSLKSSAVALGFFFTGEGTRFSIALVDHVTKKTTTFGRYEID